MLKSKKFYSIILCALLLYFALNNVDLKLLKETLATANIRFFWLTFFSYTTEYIFRSLRFKILLKGDKSFIEYFSNVVFGYFINYLLPGRAGEVARTLYSERKGLAQSGNVIASIIAERFLDISILLVFILISFNKAVTELNIKAVVIGALTLYTAIFLFFTLLIKKRDFMLKIFDKLSLCIAKTAAWFLRVFYKIKGKEPEESSQKSENLHDKIMSFLQATGENMADKTAELFNLPTLFLLIIVTALSWGATICTQSFALKMFGISPGVTSVIFLMTLLSFAGLVPVTPGSIGVYQVICIAVIHSSFGYSREQGAAYAIISHALVYLYLAIAGSIIILKEGISLKEIKTISKE
ncbi:MAG: flippase-like domain-containing protein [Candidatus Riflebacteria bacterium]|nr:flippase-like domain-containing protein [Candidatus Riflebacteria bacterium]